MLDSVNKQPVSFKANPKKFLEKFMSQGGEIIYDVNPKKNTIIANLAMGGKKDTLLRVSPSNSDTWEFCDGGVGGTIKEAKKSLMEAIKDFPHKGVIRGSKDALDYEA